MTQRYNFKGWVKLFLQRIEEHDVFGYAAQLAYFLLLSIFPLIITLISIIPFLPLEMTDVQIFVRDLVPDDAEPFLQYVLKEVMSVHDGSILSIGILVTLWSTSTGMNAIIRVINRAYDIKEERNFLIVRGISVAITIVMIFVFLLALLLPVFGKQIGLYLFAKFGLTSEFLDTWNTLRWFGSIIILFLVFVTLYMIAPSRKIKCLSIIPGALFSSLGWVLTSYVFSFYVNNFGNYTVTYGSIGAIIVFMIWIYLSGLIVILGGELNAFIEYIKKIKDDQNSQC